ncbi:CPBP family intramembrane metalloprotease [bacterium]|nr:CPBP family intramembrane metalloprotease [bacterium]
MGDKFTCSFCGKPIEPVNWKPGKLAQCKACGCDNIIPKEPDSNIRDGFDSSEKNSNFPTPVDAIIETSGPKLFDLIMGVAIIWSFEALARFLIKHEITDKTTGYLYFEAIDNILILLIALYFLCFKYKKSILDGLYLKKIGLLTIGLSIFLGFSLMFTGGLLRHIFSAGFPMNGAPIDNFLSKPKNFTFFIIGSVYFAPIFEEIYYRGFIFSILRNRIGATLGIIITSLWFGSIHGPQMGWDLAGFANITLGGFVLGTLRHKSDSLLAPILTHVTYNITLFLLGFISFFVPFL